MHILVPIKSLLNSSLLLIAFIHEERRFTAATTAWHRYVEGSPATPFDLDAAAAQMIVWHTETPLFTRVVFPFPLPEVVQILGPVGTRPTTTETSAPGCLLFAGIDTVPLR